MHVTKSVLILGGSGFIGTHLALALREAYKVTVTYYSHPIAIPGVSTFPMNIDNRNWVKKVLVTLRPDVIIYLIGYNSGEWANRNTRRAEFLHSVGPASLSSTTDITQPKFIYLSNSYVFEGTRGNYHENDTVLPISLLGKMKLSGENIVKSKNVNYLIVRSSPLYGRGNGYNLSFLDRVRMNLDRNQRFEASPYEIHSFAPISGLCDLLRRLVDSGVRNRILHYGGLTKVSYYEFAKTFAIRFGYDPSLIIPKISTQRKTLNEEYTYDFSLNSTQTIETLKIKPFLLEEGFDLIQKQLIPHF